MSERVAEATRAILASGVRDGVFPGATACVLREGRGLALVHVGNAATDPAVELVKAATLYDAASLTKVMATTPIAMRLVADGVLDLDRPLEALLPDAGTLSAMTARQLLAHASGLADWRPYFEEFDGDYAAQRERVRRRLRDETAEAAPGTRECYSDLGFWALEEVIERVAGKGLGKLVESWVLGPMALADTHFAPGNRPVRPAGDYAPTERCPWRKKVLRGEVHDDNAWAMGGVCAHAGLFSTAADVARFGVLWLDWYHGRSGRFGDLAREFSIRAGIVGGSDRCLGWDAVTPGGSSAGSRFGPASFGHTGFTGTSLWIDPEPEVVVVLLSNRVHPDRANLSIREFRPRFHDAIMEAIFE